MVSSYNYIGLSTGNQKPILEKTGLGDRLLRWHLVAIWASLKNVNVKIPVISGRLTHERIWTPEKIYQHFHIPEAIQFITNSGKKDNDNTDNINNTAGLEFYLYEPRRFVACFNYWKSIPNKFKDGINYDNFKTHINKITFKPKLTRNQINIPQTIKYLILHVRQSDLKCNVLPILKNTLPNIIGLNVYFITDADLKYKKLLMTILRKFKIKVLNGEGTLQENSNEDGVIARDYALMWYSSGIISITKRKYSAFPFCIAVQKKIPVLFLPSSNIRDSHISPNINVFLKKVSL